MTDKAFLDVHVLHAVPFSNLNRDNLGTPKQMVYGGATRARISSQCTKRAARLWLEENTQLGQALRTRRLPQLVREVLVQQHEFVDVDAVRATVAVFDLAGIKVNTPDEGDEATKLQGDQLTFTTAEASTALARVIAAQREDILSEDFKPNKGTKTKLVAPLDAHNPIIALCGRMLAALPETNVDGALQVAHAFTTHTSTLELDYFTAVDDHVQADDEETGAGYIDVGEYTSGVFYRHATVGMRQLAELLDESTPTVAETIGSFVEAFVLAEPTGKQNSANAHTRPDLVAVTIRSDRPVSFAAAFEEPVDVGRKGGYMAASISALCERATSENQMYGTDGLLGAWHLVGAADPEGLFGLGEQMPGLAGLIHEVEQATTSATSTDGGTA